VRIVCGDHVVGNRRVVSAIVASVQGAAEVEVATRRYHDYRKNLDRSPEQPGADLTPRNARSSPIGYLDVRAARQL